MEKQKILYVVFMHDPQSENCEKGSAMDSEIYTTFGPKTLFEESSCFKSPADAETYINILLKKRELLGGTLRPDITRKHFSIHPVFQSKLLPNAYWIDKEYANMY